MAARPPKPRNSKFGDNNPQTPPSNRGGRAPAWRANGAPSFAHAARQNTALASPSQRQDSSSYDPKLLASLTSQIGVHIIFTLKAGARQEGIVVSITQDGESPGVTLKEVKDHSAPSAPLKESVFFPASNLTAWVPAPKPANGVGSETVRTDSDISKAQGAPRERELRRWQPDPAVADSPASTQDTNDAFGALGKYSGAAWDQFDANEQLFGVTTKFDEEAYTTKLDTSAPDFKEREKKAQQIADEINRTATNNSHVAEERQMNGASGDLGEEEKYSAVVRSAGAYVPPGARKAVTATSGSSSPNTTIPVPAAPAPAKTPEDGPKADPAPSTSAATTPPAVAAKPTADGLVPSFREFVTNEKQRLVQKKNAMVRSEMDKRKAELLKFSKTFKLNKPIPADLVPILAKDEGKQKAILEKAKADAEAVAVAKSAASNASATSNGSRPLGSKELGTTAKVAKPAGSSVAADAAKKTKTSMYIQPIPPFDKSKAKARAVAAVGGTAANGSAAGSPRTPAASTSAGNATPTGAAPASPTPSNSIANANNPIFKLNVNASSFRPNPTAPAFKPTSPAIPSPKAKDTKEMPSPATSGPNPSPNPTSAPNPFFGNRVPPKKGTAVHIKDDFNPFRHAKVVDASAVSSIWQYSGKRFASMFPPVPPPQPHPPVVQPPPGVAGHPGVPHQLPGLVGMPTPGAPPTYDEDSAAQQAQRPQYPVMYYPPQYPYATHMQPHGQPPMMMPPQAPGFMPGPYMQPIPYPHPMPPTPAMYGAPPPSMPGVPPGPHTYMQPPPGGYPPTSPPPNGTPRGPGAMQGAPMPPHGYYPSPQMGHAIPYQVMMQPPQPGPHFDPSQGPPQQQQQQSPMAPVGH